MEPLSTDVVLPVINVACGCFSGMVLVRTELGQLVMVPQQALAQVQAQAQAQAQNSISPRPGTPTTGASFRVTTPQVRLFRTASRAASFRLPTHIRVKAHGITGAALKQISCCIIAFLYFDIWIRIFAFIGFVSSYTIHGSLLCASTYVFSPHIMGFFFQKFLCINFIFRS